MAKLDDGAFQAPRSAWSLDFSKISSTSRLAPFHSQGATHMTCNSADVYLIRDAQRLGDIRLIGDTRLGQLFHWKHFFVYQHRLPGKSISIWCYPAHYFPDSCVLNFQMNYNEFRHGGVDVGYFEFVPTKEPCLTSIFSLPEDQKVCRVVVRSWAYQWNCYPELRRKAPGIRLFRDGEFESVPRVCARRGWHELSRPVCDDICKALKIAVEPGSSFVEMLITMTMATLKCSRTAAIDCLLHRIAAMRDSNRFAKTLLEVDVCIDQLDRDEYQALVQEQKSKAETVETQRDFEKDWHAQRSACRMPGVPGGAPKPPSSFPLVIVQAEVKSYVPPGTSVWRGNTRSEWWGHCKPNSRVFARVSEFDCERSAIKHLLQELWGQHNFKTGKPSRHCPIRGSFDDVASSSA